MNSVVNRERENLLAQLTDSDLNERAQAWDYLLSKVGPKIKKMISMQAIRYNLSSNDEDDIFQDTMVGVMRLFLQKNTYNPELGGLENYVYGVARYIVIKSISRIFGGPMRRTITESELLDSDRDIEDLPDEISPDIQENLEQKLQLEVMAKQLSRGEKEILNLMLNNYSCDEIARQLNITPASVRVRLYRIRRRLHKLMTEEQRADES